MVLALGWLVGWMLRLNELALVGRPGYFMTGLHHWHLVGIYYAWLGWIDDVLRALSV
jgi:hypothetical protein